MKVELLEKARKREREARKEAESILERRSLELYNTNEQLKEALKNTNLFPEQNPDAVMRFSKETKELMYANKQDLVNTMNVVCYKSDHIYDDNL